MRISDWSSDVCSSDLVQGILDRLKSQEGQPEYHLKEIFLGATPDRLDEVARNAQGLMDEIKKGQQPFEYFTQYSEASTKAVGGDLGWVQTDTLPAPLAEAAQQDRKSKRLNSRH